MMSASTPSQRDFNGDGGDENGLTDELLQLMKPVYRLPTYREALENDDVDPPPYATDGGAVGGDRCVGRADDER